MSETADSNGYAREPITFDAAGTGAARRVTQDADVTFDIATGNWAAPITHWGIVTSATHGAGDMLAHGAFSSPFQPVTGNTPSIPLSLQEVYVQFDASSGAGLTTFAANKLLDLMFNNTAYSTPAGSTYIALSTTVLDDADAAVTDFTEVTGTAYARVEVNPNGGASPTWTTVTNGVASNTHAIVFPTVGAGGWPTFVACVIITSASGAGDVLAFDNANIVDQAANENDVVQFPIGDFDISIT